MDGADEVIPRVTRGQVPHPIFVAGEVIHFQGELDDEVGMVAAGLIDLGDVGFEVGGLHAPVVEVVAGHGIVVREADFLEAKPDSLRRQFSRFTRSVAAEGCVRMIICGQRHARM